MIFNVIGAIFAGIQRFLFQVLTERIGRDLRQDVFEEIIKQQVSFFDERRTGDLISRLQADTAKIENALATQVGMLVKSSLYCTIVLVMFFLISWKMSLFTLGIMLPTMFFGPIYGKAVRRVRKDLSDRQADASNVAEEAFSNIRTVKAFATEDRECKEYSIRNDKVYECARLAAVYYAIFSFVMQFVMFGSLDALVYFASYLNTRGELTIGEFT